MNAIQTKTLKDAGFSEAAIIVLEEITEIKAGDLVTKKDLDVTKLELEKQIIQVKLELEKQIVQVKLELQKEIQQVKLEIQQVKLEIEQSKVELLKAMNNQIWKIISVMIVILSPFYAILIKNML